MSTASASNKYGRFLDDGAFEILRPETPRPWVNFLSNGRYGAIVSQTGGGYAWHRVPGKDHLLRWHPAAYLDDRPGRYLYLRDAATGRFWSATHAPCGRSDAFRCVHRPGRTTIEAACEGVAASVTYAVPPADDVEVWLVSLASDRPREIEVYPFAEFLVGDYFFELSTRNIAILYNEAFAEPAEARVVARKFPVGDKPAAASVFMTTTLAVDAAECDLERFLGRYGSYERPGAVASGALPGSPRARGMNMCGAFRARLRLEPGRPVEFAVVLGPAADLEAARAAAASWRDLGRARRAVEAAAKSWDAAVAGAGPRIETPERTLDRFANGFLKFQVWQCNHWGRSATYYHEGHGEFGYRNTAQDAFGILSTDPAYAIERLVMLAKHQRPNGECMPGWTADEPSTGRPTSDFPMWLPFLLDAVVRETGDLSLLKREVPFFDEKFPGRWGDPAPLYDHAVRAMRFLMDRASGVHGIPLMGTQDWNDAFDRCGFGGKGESVMLAMGLLWGLEQTARMAEMAGDPGTAADCRARAKTIDAQVNEVAWDGDRYVRAYDDSGRAIGCRADGRVFIETQSWAVISGCARGERRDAVIRHLEKTLWTEYGQALFVPPYTELDRAIGRITAFAEGTKENAAVFTHMGMFAALAQYEAGRPDAAWRSIRAFLPYEANKDPEVFLTEPYVLPEYTIGPGNPRFGEGAFTWLTGSSDWLLWLLHERLLGVRPLVEGLRIRPALPSAWDRARLRRPFRGATYEIEIRRDAAVAPGGVVLSLDGTAVAGDVVPYAPGAHRVEARIGPNVPER